MYFLLSCNYPFNGDDMKMLLRNIVAANYSFDDADNSAMQWSNVSFEARDLISKLL